MKFIFLQLFGEFFFGKAWLVEKVLGKEKGEQLEKKFTTPGLGSEVREVDGMLQLFVVGVQQLWLMSFSTLKNGFFRIVKTKGLHTCIS